jgi:hypothetical protein
MDLYDAERFPFIINYIFYASKMFRDYLPYIVQNPAAGFSFMGVHMVVDSLVLAAKIKAMESFLKKTMGEDKAKYAPWILYTASKLAKVYFDPKGQLTGIGTFLLARIPASYLPEKLKVLKNFINWLAYYAGQEYGEFVFDKAISENILVKNYQDLRADAGPEACNGLKTICDKNFMDVTFPGTHNSFHHRDQGKGAFYLNNQLYNLRTQFNAGIRSFSIDFTKIPDKNSVNGTSTIHAVHDTLFTFEPLVDALKEFKKLLEENPREVIRFIPERVGSFTYSEILKKQDSINIYPKNTVIGI